MSYEDDGAVLIDLGAERSRRRPLTMLACPYCDSRPILRDLVSELRCDDCGHSWPVVRRP